MEYPNAIFTRPLRRALLALFIIAFLVIAPTLIAYTAGYHYDFKNGLFKETGSLSVDILPNNTTVYLNNTKIADSVPLRLKNVNPYQYTLRLTAPGYYDWQKEIKIVSKETTYIKDITLIKKDTPLPLHKGIVDTLSLSPSGRYLLYTTAGEKHRTLVLFDTKTETTTTVALSNNLSTEILKITWAKKNNYFTINQSTPPYRHLWVGNAENLKNIINVAALTPEAIDKFMWKETTEPELYYSTKKTINAFLPLIKEARPVAPNNYQDWLLQNGGLWTLQKSTTTDETIIVEDTLGFKENFATVVNSENGSPWQLALANNTTVLLKNKKAPEMLLVRQDKKFTLAGEKFLLSPYNNWWILWSKTELWGYSEGEDPYLLNRSGEKLQDVHPIDEHNTLALEWGGKITVIFPYYFIEHELANHPVTAIVANGEDRILYYTDKDGLWKLTY